MIKVIVVDRHAEARNGAFDKLSKLLLQAEDEAKFLPRISLKQLSLEELKFHRAPDLCVVGPELTKSEPHEIGAIKKHLPHTPLVVWIEGSLDILQVEQLARYGADDLLNDGISAEDFYKKIILLSRRSDSENSGKLIVVDGAKGGVGVTTATAALADILLQHGKSVALVDGDIETQDLTRFLQAKPYVNENLKLLFDGQRPITEESVQQCLVPLWGGGDKSSLMSPVPDSDEVLDSTSVYIRSFLSILEILNEKYEYVLLDMGCFRGLFWKALVRAADTLLFITNNDPASLFASVNKIARTKGLLSSGSEFLLCLNGVGRQGLPARLYLEEIARAAKLTDDEIMPVPVPFCAQGNKWPGSEGTFYSLSQKFASRAFESLATNLGLIEHTATEENNIRDRLFDAVQTLRTRLLPTRDQSIIPVAVPAKQLASEKPKLPQLPEPNLEEYSAELFFTPAEISHGT